MLGEVHDHVNSIHVLVHLEHEELDILSLVTAQCDTAAEHSVLVEMSLVRGLLHSSSIILLRFGCLVSSENFSDDLDRCQLLHIFLKHEQVEHR